MTDRERLIELIYCAGRDYDDYVDSQHEMGMPAHEDFDEWLADELLANGVIVPPCKVGDMVYEVDYDFESGDIVIVQSQVSGVAVMTTNNIHRTEYINKTVFLTKEDAEQALKERENV